MKEKARSLFVAILVVLSLVGCEEVLHGQEKPSRSGKVTFLDGSSLDFRSAEFVYTGMRRSDGQYVNPPMFETRSPDFHYKEEVGKVELERVIRGSNLEQIHFDYLEGRERLVQRPKTEVVLQKIIIKVTDGTVFVIGDRLFGERSMLSDSLVGGAQNDRDPTVFQRLDIQGIAVVEGQPGRFRFELLSHSVISGNRYLPREEQRGEVCFNCKIRSVIVKEILFVESAK